MITNFHQPECPPLIMTCAFGGRERVLGAYAGAIARGYRFYSFGDSMMLV
jgi:S-adenosylmethionine:tRNA ribosyltransferase-isomerase